MAKVSVTLDLVQYLEIQPERQKHEGKLLKKKPSGSVHQTSLSQPPSRVLAEKVLSLVNGHLFLILVKNAFSCSHTEQKANSCMDN